MMDWKPWLQEGESLRWEGRPAPRAYVFRNWKHALFGVMLLLLAAYWQIVALQMAAVYHKPWLPFIPLPFLLIGLYLGIGHLLLARLEWERVFYALTDRRLLVLRGMRQSRLDAFDLAELTSFMVRPLGNELASIRVNNRDSGARLMLIAIEHPQQLTTLLEECLLKNGYQVTLTPV